MGSWLIIGAVVLVVAALALVAYFLFSEPKPNHVPAGQDDRRLDLLMTYTTFHIGVYLSLTTAVIGASLLKNLDHTLLRWAGAWFLIAGICGGIIAGNLAEYRGSVDAFFSKQNRLTLWNRTLPGLSYRRVAVIEHAAFWLGILPLAVTFVVCGLSGFSASD